MFYEPFVLCVALFDQKKNSPKQKPTTIGYLQYSCVGEAVNGARHRQRWYIVFLINRSVGIQ